jgi:hypothetical protein
VLRLSAAPLYTIWLSTFYTLGVPVIRLLQPSSYEDDDLERQNDDKQDSVKIDCHDFTSMVCCRF